LGQSLSALSNNAADRSYPFTYVISAANTWEYKTVTITGDTTGTWLKDNGIGFRVQWSIGAGSNYAASANAWAAQWAFSATGSTNLISTINATLQITGVQLEKGSTATSFDYRPYGTELALCQRYYETFTVAVPSVSGFTISYGYKATKRATPTFSGGASGFSSTGSSADTLICYQTTSANQTISASSEL
jgi:hypothetical protein